MATGSRSIFKGSEEAFMFECEPCKYQNIISEGKAYCTVCTEYLCPRCEQAHKGSKLSRGNKILIEKDFQSISMTTKTNIPTCDTHKTMKLGTYCKDHDDVICDTCKITDHITCVTTDVGDQTQHLNINRAFDDVVKSLTDTKLQYERLAQTRRGDKDKVMSQLSKCLEDVRKTRKEINITFDKLERKFEKEVKEIEYRLFQEIDNHVTIVEDAKIQISDQIKSLGEYRKSKIDDAMFVGIKRAEKLNIKYDQTLSSVKQTTFPINFKENDVISDVINNLNSIGTFDGLKTLPPSGQRTASLLQTSVVNKREIDISKSYVWDCTFMKSAHLVLAGGDRLLLLDESFKVNSQLSVRSYRVAAINENEVVVTKIRQLLRVRVFPQMVVMTTVKMDSWCWGVDVFNDEIYVACQDGKGHGELQVLNMDGKMQRKLGVNNGKYMFVKTEGVKVSQDGSKIFVSDVGTHKLTCLNQQGHVIYQYSDPDLKFPKGLYVDEEDTLIVCGSHSNNIHMVGRNGRKVKVWLTQEDGVVKPECVSYRQKDGCLVVGLWSNDKALLVLNTK